MEIYGRLQFERSAPLKKRGSTLLADFSLVARQPILDLRGSQCMAYGCFSGKERSRKGTGGQSLAPWQTTAAFFLSHKPSELKKLTGKLTAFVSCSIAGVRAIRLLQTLPSTLTVLEIAPPPGNLA